MQSININRHAPRRQYMPAMSTAQLIRYYRELRGLNQSELARRIGITPQAVQHWEQKNTAPKSALLPKIAAALGVEPRDLAVGAPVRELGRFIDIEAPDPVGESPQARPASQPPVRLAAVEVTTQTAIPTGYVYTGVQIQHLPVNGGQMKEVEAIVVSPEWVRRRMPGRNPTAIFVIEAYGDAMAPTLAEGDWVFVDTEKQDLNFDAVWVLRQRQTREIWIRRVQRRPDGAWALLSDNNRYPPVVVPLEQRSMFDVLGQVAMRNNLALM